MRHTTDLSWLSGPSARRSLSPTLDELGMVSPELCTLDELGMVSPELWSWSIPATWRRRSSTTNRAWSSGRPATWRAPAMPCGTRWRAVTTTSGSMWRRAGSRSRSSRIPPWPGATSAISSSSSASRCPLVFGPIALGRHANRPIFDAVEGLVQCLRALGKPKDADRLTALAERLGEGSNSNQTLESKSGNRPPADLTADESRGMSPHPDPGRNQ
jgi:hypothetical protein